MFSLFPALSRLQTQPVLCWNIITAALKGFSHKIKRFPFRSARARIVKMCQKHRLKTKISLARSSISLKSVLKRPRLTELAADRLIITRVRNWSSARLSVFGSRHINIVFFQVKRRRVCSRTQTWIITRSESWLFVSHDTLQKRY